MAAFENLVTNIKIRYSYEKVSNILLCTSNFVLVLHPISLAAVQYLGGKRIALILPRTSSREAIRLNMQPV